MPDKQRRKTPDSPETRRPKQEKRRPIQDVGAARAPLPDWLPAANAGFAAWGQAAERAYREYRTAYELHLLNRGHPILLQNFEVAVELMLYTLERAYPDGFWEGMEDLKAGKTGNLELYIAFLAADSYFFRSGYVKTDVIRYLKRIPLTPVQQRRLQDVVLHVVDKGFRREFRVYCHLARHVQSADWLQKVESRLVSFDPNQALRAQWVLEACRKK